MPNPMTVKGAEDLRGELAHRKGALRQEISEAIAEARALIKSLNTPFTLYDEDGEAASYLGNALVQQLGFEKVSYLKDGIYGWREAGMPLVDYTP